MTFRILGQTGRPKDPRPKGSKNRRPEYRIPCLKHPRSEEPRWKGFEVTTALVKRGRVWKVLSKKDSIKRTEEPVPKGLEHRRTLVKKAWCQNDPGLKGPSTRGPQSKGTGDKWFPIKEALGQKDPAQKGLGERCWEQNR